MCILISIVLFSHQILTLISIEIYKSLEVTIFDLSTIVDMKLETRKYTTMKYQYQQTYSNNWSLEIYLENTVKFSHLLLC